MRAFWRGIVIFFLGGIFGTALGVALGFFFFPFVFPPPTATEQLTEVDRKPVGPNPLWERQGQRLSAYRLSRC
jgi:hypothetical protein